MVGSKLNAVIRNAGAAFSNALLVFAIAIQARIGARGLNHIDPDKYSDPAGLPLLGAFHSFCSDVKY